MPVAPPLPVTPGRRVVLLVGVPVLLLLVAWAAVPLLGLLGRTSGDDRATLAGATRLEVQGGTVTVSAAPSSSAAGARGVEVVQTSRWTWREPRLEARVDADGVAHVATACPWVEQVVSWSCRADLSLVVPADLPVRVRGSGGPVSVSGLDATVDAASSGGQVRLAELGGDVVASSSGGGVVASRLGSDAVRVESSGGSVSLAFSSTPSDVSATTSAGSVTVVLPPGSGPYAVDASTSAGSTTVDVPTDPGAPRSVVARSSAGSVVVR